MSKKENADFFAGIEMQEGEKITAETLNELSNGKGEDEDKVNKKLSSTAPPVTPTKEYAVGDTVQFTGCLHYTSSYSGGVAKGCKAGVAKVTAISKGKPHPYHLKAVAGKGSTVYGWVNASDIAELTSSTNKSPDEIAKEVIRGIWGKGQDRKNRLTSAGYNYNEVQKRVNQLLK